MKKLSLLLNAFIRALGIGLAGVLSFVLLSILWQMYVTVCGSHIDIITGIIGIFVGILTGLFYLNNWWSVEIEQGGRSDDA